MKSRRERGFGPLRIGAELRERGISAELITRYLDEGSPPWLALARREHEKRWGRDQHRSPRERIRQVNFLRQRGFGPEVIRIVIDAQGRSVESED